MEMRIVGSKRRQVLGFLSRDWRRPNQIGMQKQRLYPRLRTGMFRHSMIFRAPHDEEIALVFGNKMILDLPHKLPRIQINHLKIVMAIHAEGL